MLEVWKLLIFQRTVKAALTHRAAVQGEKRKWSQYFPIGKAASTFYYTHTLSVSVWPWLVCVCVFCRAVQPARATGPWARRTGGRSAWSWRLCSSSSDCRSSRSESSPPRRWAAPLTPDTLSPVCHLTLKDQMKAKLVKLLHKTSRRTSILKAFLISWRLHSKK